MRVCGFAAWALNAHIRHSERVAPRSRTRPVTRRQSGCRTTAEGVGLRGEAATGMALGHGVVLSPSEFDRSAIVFLDVRIEDGHAAAQG